MPTYTVPDNPTDPEAAALELIVQLPVEGAFADIVAAFDGPPHCEVGSSAGDRCPLPARFYAIFHACSHGLICERHERAFRRQLDNGDRAQCNGCGRVFASIDHAVTVVAL